MPSRFFLVLLLPLLVLSACRLGPSSSDTLFRKRSPEATGLHFVNTIEEDTSTFNLVDYYYVYNGAGVAVGDVNNDSLPDLYFSGNQVPGRLYLNQGNLQFKDVTTSSGIDHEGWATGVTFADVNGDGALDLYVCRAGPHPPERRANLLYLNDGTGTFTERASDYGLADTSASTQAAFFDYDKDGDLDLFLANHSNRISNPNRIRPLVTDGTGLGNDRLYRNDGTTFTDVTAEAGIVYPGMSLGVGINDLNGDGWEDVYVSNDFLAHDYLYLNNGDGTFSEKGTEVLKHHSYAAMGNDLADVNNDGWVDIMVVDMRPPDNEQQKRMAFPLNYRSFKKSLEMGYHPQYWRNTLQLSNGLNAAGKLSFSDIGQYAGVEATDWSWAPLLADFNNDGLRDLWITNGYRRAMIDLDFIDEYINLQRKHGVKGAEDEIIRKANQMYEVARTDHVYRNAGELAFEDASAAWGVTEPSFSNGAAYADLDRDGDLDMVINNIDQPAALYENTIYGSASQDKGVSKDKSTAPDEAAARERHFLTVYFTGPGKNTRGLGAELRLVCDGRSQRYHHAVTRGYQSSVGYPAHFGLGACQSVDSLRVTWPDGATQQLTDVSADQALYLRYEEARPHSHDAPSPPKGLLTRVDPATGLAYRHEEEPFNDFSVQRLLPHQLSRSGPGLAAGDVNGDGRDDLFIGGAFRHPGHLFPQSPDGSFQGRPLGEEPYYMEDTASLFFDADGDRDLDLYVAAGSNEFARGSEHLQDRLYLNDGTGHFALAPDALPDLTTSSSCVVATDYDRDGDLDLFVGGRLAPRRYPLPGRSHLLENEGDGTFADVTRRVAPALRAVGMVTSALWTDFNTDGRVDLIVVGEFMAIRFFENTGSSPSGRRFRDVTDATGLQHTEGWWNSITGGDFDRDGDTDYVVGNLGLNTRYEASPSEPVSVYAADFDLNRHIDPVLTHFVQGKEVPVPRRDEFMTQLPRMRQRFPDYESYATATTSDIFSPEQLDRAQTLRATRFESSYLENLGGGRFRIRALPTRAQLGPLYGLLADDVTQDGNLDVLAVGNSYAPDVITGRHDALIGVLLRGDGTGGFEAVPHQESGFFVDGDAKGLARLQGAGGRSLYVATQNDDTTRVFTYADGNAPRTVPLASLDAYAEIAFADGTVERRELYYGAGYWSQSARRLQVPPGATQVTLYQYDGSSRTVEF